MNYTCGCGQPFASMGELVSHARTCQQEASSPSVGGAVVSWAPDYDVPENVSPFKPLPMLERCPECREPITPLEQYVVIHKGNPQHGLCAPCAARAPSRIPPAPPTDTTGPEFPLPIVCRSCGRALANLRESCCGRFVTADDVVSSTSGEQP
jgi:hypothetical protein